MNKDNFLKGFIKENPLFVLLLGTCPALAVTTSLGNALGMTLAFTFVMVLSNLIISLINASAKLKELVAPVRIAVYIVVIASLVTVVEMILHAFIPALYESLGVFISLITVNCIVLGRAEAYASQNKPLDSVIDGVSMGLGYGMALVIIATIREVIGNGTITLWGEVGGSLSLRIIPEEYVISAFTQSAGAFLVLGIILAIMQAIQNSKKKGDK